MLTRYALILLLSLPVFAQTTSPPLVDFSLVGITKPVTMGSTPPDTCEEAQLFFSTSAPAGLNLFSCDAVNTWTVIGSGAPAVLSDIATSGSYADLLDIPSFSSVAMSGSYADLLNAPAFLLPSGNAASATKLATAPTVCGSGLYTTGITAWGNANCAQVQYSQIGARPAAYALPQATTTVLGGVMAGTGISATTGVLAVKYGALAGTAAQGNDGRILGALQKSTALADLKLISATPVTINSPTTGRASTSGIADIARSLQGAGPLRMKGTCSSTGSLTLGTTEIGVWLDADCNLHLKDYSNLNRSVMVRTWIAGVEQKCDQSKGFSAMTDFLANGAPVCTVAPTPPPAPTGVTVSGSSCIITAITNGVITSASCTP